MEWAVHPLAEHIPRMSVEEYEQFREDIRENGLRTPITLYENQVLDGRHRMRACEETGTAPRFESYEGDDPAGFVLSENVIGRRHLTPGQKAMAVRHLMPHLKNAARGRMAEGGRKSAPGKGVSGEPPFPASTSNPDGRVRAADEAAALVGVSRATINRANYVADNDPEMAERVSGGFPVGAAERIIKERKQQTVELSGRHMQNRAHSHHRRIETIVGQLQAYEHLDELNVELATAVATQSDLDRWHEAIKSARHHLALLAKRIPQHHSEGDSDGDQ